MVDIKQLSKSNGAETYLVKGTTPAYLNTIRRMVINRVPTMAIDEVTFIDNGSALFDEFIAHRLGLIPLKTDLKSYFVKETCKCKGNGCARCELTLTLDKKGPCTVYAEDIKSADPKVIPVHPKTIIAKLLEGQNIKFEAKAKLGSGKEHIKFSSGLVHYKGYPEIKINAKNAGDIPTEVCPVKILKKDGKNVKVTDATACTLCKACEDVAPEAITVTANDKNFILTIEPWGQLTSNEMVATAMELLDEDLDELKNNLKKIK